MLKVVCCLLYANELLMHVAACCRRLRYLFACWLVVECSLCVVVCCLVAVACCCVLLFAVCCCVFGAARCWLSCVIAC